MSSRLGRNLLLALEDLGHLTATALWRRLLVLSLVESMCKLIGWYTAVGCNIRRLLRLSVRIMGRNTRRSGWDWGSSRLLALRPHLSFHLLQAHVLLGRRDARGWLR